MALFHIVQQSAHGRALRVKGLVERCAMVSQVRLLHPITMHPITIHRARAHRFFRGNGNLTIQRIDVVWGRQQLHAGYVEDY